jgi:sensor histidine kinase YesM
MTTVLLLISCIFFCLIILLIFWMKNKELRNFKKNSEQQLAALETKLNSFELRNIDSKLNPHLFKNILNSIQSHAFQTYYAIDKLSNVLDYFLYESRKNYVSPKDEIEFAKNLIEINKIKLSPLFELNLKFKIDEADPVYTRDVLAPLISIDLIENAFKHADLQSSDAFISIVIELKNSVFSLMVSNKISNQQFLKKSNSGIGAQTLESRLTILYKERYKLERKVENAVYIAQLKLNLLDYDAKVYTTG